jgi:hypothetical protein
MLLVAHPWCAIYRENGRASVFEDWKLEVPRLKAEGTLVIVRPDLILASGFDEAVDVANALGASRARVVIVEWRAVKAEIGNQGAELLQSCLKDMVATGRALLFSVEDEAASLDCAINEACRLAIWAAPAQAVSVVAPTNELSTRVRQVFEREGFAVTCRPGLSGVTVASDGAGAH